MYMDLLMVLGVLKKYFHQFNNFFSILQHIYSIELKLRMYFLVLIIAREFQLLCDPQSMT